MDFQDTSFTREHRFSLGIETESGRSYLSIPVSNGPVDYEEYYEISAADHERLGHDDAAAAAFADECRRHEHDGLLIQKPGWNRGTPA
ncbi:hypothetical protein [Nocardioides mangrovi]|uniref:Uncharacterized protein n=1 Tax=Nocardioides mangrovi TaxID=2874580 RepID=A0ABS7UIJ0_9ACTN|nr:hypothetical protein [Nocardioides mangrovi]MBZ5740654.1 hypothetical protein [Nocardioides mangrovi]